MNLPTDVQDWFRDLFRACDLKITTRLARNPNTQEESLDMAFIDFLADHISPVTLDSGWTVKINAHFIGGLRHFRGKWEIADIGLLAHYFNGKRHLHSKAAVLQSKRLYPSFGAIKEEVAEDYILGFARLSDPEDYSIPIYENKEYRYSERSQYRAMRVDDHQWKAIQAYLEESKIPVFHQFYNPPDTPYSIHVPLLGTGIEIGTNNLGTRIIPSADLLTVGTEIGSGKSPSLETMKKLFTSGDYFGWKLENFIADEFLPCNVGYKYGGGEPSIENLFYRRSGPISSAVSFSIASPED